MKQITLDAFGYRELSETAQARARDHLRESSADNDWYEWVYHDADNIATLMGITIARKRGQRGGVLFHSGEPDISFSGFYSQGDGASFVGRYAYREDAIAQVKSYAPADTELHKIVETLDAIQRRLRGCLIAEIVRNLSHYVHENTVDISVGAIENDADEIDEARVDRNSVVELRDTLRAFMRWIYRQLESEYERLTSDEELADRADAEERIFSSTGEDLSRFSH